MDCNKVMEKFGIYFDEVGLNKTYGRMFGFFMTTKEPVSMGKLVKELQISKSTASMELRRLLSMGVIEKVILVDERADFYQLRKNIWAMNLRQKIEDVKRLRSIIEEIPADDLDDLQHLKAMADYCTFLEPELETLVKKYMNKMTTSGSYRMKEQKWIVEWHKLSALSDAFAEKMKSLASLGINAFVPVEMEFLSQYPRAMDEDKSLAGFSQLHGHELELAIHTRLEKIFLTHPKEFPPEVRASMANIYYYLVMVRDEVSKELKGFITFMGGGSMPEHEFKITVLAVDEKVRRAGIAGALVQSLDQLGIRSKKMFVSTRPSNSAAIKAYKKWGFKEDFTALKSSPSHFVNGHWVHLVYEKLY